MPSVSTRPAKPGSVKVALTNTMKATVNRRFASRAMHATKPAKR
jgi:hypothetical protein